MENPNGESYYEKFDGVARTFGMSVAAAFFASLERFSCVNLDTSDSDDENEEEARDRPLMSRSFQSFDSSASPAISVSHISDVNGKNATPAVENLPV